MIEAETPTLWDIQQRLGHPAAVAILVNAFIHAAKLVNLDKNLTIEQIGEAANDTLEAHGYLKVEEVKFLLKRALRTQNVYGRLDYNVLMNWVEAYDAERTEEAIRISEQEDARRLNTRADTEGTINITEYIKQLEVRAEADENAAALLETYRAMVARPAVFSDEEKAARENGFRQFKIDYMLKRHADRRNPENH